jgi:hypothetical protein
VKPGFRAPPARPPACPPFFPVGCREDQLRQERTKAWLHVLLDISSMVCVILSDPALPHSPTPLSAMVVTSFLAVLDMVRVTEPTGMHRPA